MGYVVEINSGISGLIAAIVLGKRKKTTPDPHHIPMAALGEKHGVPMPVANMLIDLACSIAGTDYRLNGRKP